MINWPQNPEDKMPLISPKLLVIRTKNDGTQY